jgi:hypothetical protein
MAIAFIKPTVGLLILTATVQMAQAQGTLYLSTLEQNQNQSYVIGNNLWLAQGIETGTDSGGYVLNSVQLEMVAATGNPSGFIVSIYSALNGDPSTDLGALNGSSNPSSAGLYTYTASSISLAPSTEYFIVATDATPTTQGYYVWSDTLFDASYTSVNDWSIQENLTSPNGSTWGGARNAGYQIEINATVIPEPSTWAMFVTGGIAILVGRRRKTHLCSLRSLLFPNEWFG